MFKGRNFFRYGVEHNHGLFGRDLGIQGKTLKWYKLIIILYIASVIEVPFFEQDVMVDELADIREKKRKATLAQRRSFFVHMVSDPNIQPGFTKTPNRAKLDTQATIGGLGSNANPQT